MCAVLVAVWEGATLAAREAPGREQMMAASGAHHNWNRFQNDTAARP
jgi:hypothetical protein